MLQLSSRLREPPVLPANRIWTTATRNGIYTMSEEERNALERSLNDICEELNADDILRYLLTIGVVQDVKAQEIRAISRESLKNMQLITIVKAAGPSAFQEFINALEIFHQGHLADKLLPHLESFLDEQLTFSEMSTSEHSSAQAASNAEKTSFDSNSCVQVSHMHGGTQSNQVALGNINSGVASGQHNAFNNYNYQGRMVGGPVHGGTINFGDHYHYPQENRQPLPAPPPTSEKLREMLKK
uniref:Protein disulfide-isomerase n=1 Tax=Plectus sambesii TaxID=2011161 RepID=A0A914XAJ6_9BILA